MPVERPQIPELIGRPATEEAQLLRAVAVFHIIPFEQIEIGHRAIGVGERADKFPLMKKMQPLRRRKQIIRIPVLQPVRGDHLAERDRGIDQCQENTAPKRQFVAAELPPDQLPLRCEILAVTAPARLKLGREGGGVHIMRQRVTARCGRARGWRRLLRHVAHRPATAFP